VGKRGTFCFLAYEAVYPYCNWLNGDCDGNGTVSFADIGCFVNLIGQGGSGVTRAYTWDAENRLTRVGPPAGGEAVAAIQVTFRYDYLGRRVEKQVSTWSGTAWTVTQTRRYVWDGWRMLLEMDGSGTILKKYTWGLDLAGLNGQVNSLEGAGTISGLLAVQVVGGAVGGGDLNYAYLYDANGNVGQLVDWAHDANDPAGALVAKYEYDPYGGVTLAAGGYAADNVWRFSTKQFDAETGLGYWGYRYYSPTLGRWISRDPLSQSLGPNEYSYTHNSATITVDALGLTDWAKAAAYYWKLYRALTDEGAPFARELMWHYAFGNGQPFKAGMKYVHETVYDPRSGTKRTEHLSTAIGNSRWNMFMRARPELQEAARAYLCKRAKQYAGRDGDMAEQPFDGNLGRVLLEELDSMLITLHGTENVPVYGSVLKGCVNGATVVAFRYLTFEWRDDGDMHVGISTTLTDGTTISDEDFLSIDLGTSYSISISWISRDSIVKVCDDTCEFSGDWPPPASTDTLDAEGH